jgi:hypothetical protein
MNQRTENIIRNLEPDFDIVEEQIIEHYRLKYEGLQVRQLNWWLDELSRLESKLPMGSQKMDTLQIEAFHRAGSERGSIMHKYTELQEEYIEHQMAVHDRLRLSDVMPWLTRHAKLKHALADIEGATLATFDELDAEAKVRARKERGV